MEVAAASSKPSPFQRKKTNTAVEVKWKIVGGLLMVCWSLVGGLLMVCWWFVGSMVESFVGICRLTCDGC